MPSKLTLRWRTRDITVFTRMDAVEGVEGAHQVLARRLRCYGELAIHPIEIVEYIVRDVTKPEQWEVVFGHKTKYRRWALTHRTSGMRFSAGKMGTGFEGKYNAKQVAEAIEREFGEMLRSLPATATPDGITNALMMHPRYDDLLERKRALEDRFSGPQRVPRP